MRSTTRAVENIMIAARMSARILSLDEIIVMEDPDLRGLRERVELELLRAYERGRKARRRS